MKYNFAHTLSGITNDKFTTYFDDPGRIEREPGIYAGLDRDELAQVAAEYLAPARRVSLTVLPDNS